MVNIVRQADDIDEELRSQPLYPLDVSRREFLQLLGAGLTVLVTACAATGQNESGESGMAGRGGVSHAQEREVEAWLHIDGKGAVTVYCGKVEVGQNVRTSLAQAVAQELRSPLDAVSMVLADTAMTPYDAGTFGSRTTPYTAPVLRQAAASARESLIDLAAQKWGVDRAGLDAQNGQVIDPAKGKSVSYGELTAGKDILKEVNPAAPLTPANRWTIAGKSARKVDGLEIVTGRHRFASDTSRPGMVYGKVLRPPHLGDTLVSLDSKAAEALPGVTVAHDGDFVGVTAPTTFAAQAALDALVAKWNHTPQTSDIGLFTRFKQEGGAGRVINEQGSAQANQDPALTKLTASYTGAYIAHAPLEPRSAVAEFDGDRLTVWASTTRPFGVHEELSRTFGIPLDHVRVISPDFGAGYGGKHTAEWSIEATRLARAAHKPVKLIWAREEEFTWAYFRPAGLMEVSASARPDGALVWWEFHNYNAGPPGIGTPYDVPNQRIVVHSPNSPLRQGSYRALATTVNTFARESAMDEMAHALNMDPLQFRLKNLKDDRLRAVFQAAADRFGWGIKPAAGRGVGLAGGMDKGGRVATFAEVEPGPTGMPPRVIRLVTAFECGAIVNPDQLTNQIQGAAVMGLGGALFEAIQFADGVIKNDHFASPTDPDPADYRVPRFGDLPDIQVVLVDRKDQPSAGAGETPITAIAPAIANALFHATGDRRRHMPLA